jgi:hypothetical protein
MRKLILTTLALLLTTSWQPAQAKLTLVFDDPNTEGIDITVEDNSTWDTDEREGAIEYCNQSGVFLTCTDAASKPVNGNANSPGLFLAVTPLTYSGPMNIMLSDTDFTVGSSTAFADTMGFVEGGDTITFNFYGDSGNQAFAQGFLIHTFGPVSSPDDSLLSTATPPVGAVGSLTISISLTNEGNTKMDGGFNAAIELFPSEGNAEVPNVVGLEQTDAEDAIEAAGLKVGSVSTQANSTVQAGDVISQTPSAGTSVAPGASVALVVSAGSDPVPIANPAGLAGLWYDEAFDGEGYSILVTSSSMFLYYYGHDATGKRLWLISDTFSGSYQFGQSIELGLFRGSGTFADPAPELEAWGTLIIIFDSCTSGRAHMDGIDGTKRHDLVKLTGIGDLDCDG